MSMAIVTCSQTFTDSQICGVRNDKGARHGGINRLVDRVRHFR